MAMRSAMDCPNCGSERTRVVNTCPDASGTYQVIRRHKCTDCDHRWYAGNPYPVVIPYVTYLGHGTNQRLAAT